MAEQSQTISKCADLRETCQRAIFDKMDSQHGETLAALSGINEKIAYKEGQESRNKLETAPTKKNSPWSGLLKQIVVMWGPPTLFILLLGVIYWLKKGGWL
jgi:hypothetical protein